ncbi:hypothetical protein M2454_000002 [Aequitasia blattaphilus]|uniref:Transcriptional regulator TetR C-terminal Firmicutes type domain-containing protein n=1 Tax=Aequitasia blattaphilus TaxID=2949332 RepID=A0ABT1E4M6_9FIRM|nr:hypothetical protein [Aequitasia blattaphilus]MCP1100798.1 hypothetical protein [Aequitasia blattaphilus]MCR8613438.1 hypothetical protein [Aequitasia blattaphilus]
MFKHVQLEINCRLILDEYEQMPPKESVYIFFDRVYNLIEENTDRIEKMFKNNKETDYAFSSFQTYMRSKVREIFDKCAHSSDYKIPAGMVAEHYSNILLLVMEWSFWKGNKLSRKQAHEYLRALIGNQ